MPQVQPMPEAAPLVAHALLLAERLDPRGLDRRGPQLPGVLVLGGVAGRFAFAFRWGTLVTIGAPLEDARALGAQLCRHLADAVPAPAHETAMIRIGPAADGTGEEGVDEASMVRLHDGSLPRLALVADALAKSAALAHKEAMLARTLAQLEPPLERLRRGRLALPARVLVPLIGEAIAARARAAARVDTPDKPDLLWEHPQLAPLYAALAAEWELDERTEALGRKLEMVREMSEKLLALAEPRRSRMLELAVAALIATAVATTLYGLVAH
jgi:uncharacterized Rmd1/YagE family protein